MADQRITQLTALDKASVAAGDVLPIADVSASQTKKVTVKNLVDAGLDLVDASSIDLSKLDQASLTKLATAALADDAVTGAKLADGSSIVVSAAAPTADNFEGRGWLNSATGVLSVYRSGAYSAVTPSLVDLSVSTAKLADGAVTTAKASSLGTDALANDAVTYAKIQNVSATDRLLGRSSAGSGDVEEIVCTAAGRALLDDASAAAQRTTLGLGTLATQSGTFTGTHSGTTSGTNTGDQTITLTGEVTGSGTGSFAATIQAGAVTEAKLASGAVATAKVADDAITAAKLADQSAAVVAASTPTGNGAFIGQQWLNTNSGIEYTWTGTAWLRQASLGTINFSDSTPIGFSVAYPDAYTATITTSLDNQAAATVLAGPATGADAAPTFRALVPGDLPAATASTRGIIQPGTGLSVTSGTLNHSNSATAGTYPKVTVDAQGHVTAGTTLSATDIPSLDASKITSGTFATAQIADDAVTGAKLANYSTAKFGEAIPVADFIGQIFFNPLAEAFFLWDGNVWQPLGISAGAVIFAGTYNATTNKIASVTSEGTAIGLVVGSPLPAAVALNKGYYVVVSIGGTGVAPAPVVSLSPPDLILSNGAAWSEIDVSSTYVSQTASNVGFSAAGQIGSTNVQAAIEEVSTECRNADNITSGTLLATRGGTGLGSYTKGDLLAASGATALSKLGVGTNGQVLRANSATATGLEWGLDYVGTVTNVTGSGAISVATGTTTPAISVASASTTVAGVVQLSDSTSTTSSVLAATPTAVKSAYDLAAAAMPKAGGVFSGDITLGVNIGLVFEGATDNTLETRLIAADPTTDNTITLPNISGTVITSGDTGTVSNAMLAGSIADTKLSTISTAGKVSNSATTATSANTASAIVARDASGNFTAGTITATFSGTTFLGTTSLALNRTSANQALTGISSIALPGATSGTVTIQPAAAAGTTTITFPATTGTVVTTGDTGSVTNTMLAGSIDNAKLANSTISGVALGGTLSTLTLGTGLSGTSYNGSAAVTAAVSYGTTATTACVGNDSRLSDARNVTGGSAGTIPYQTAANTTAHVTAGTAGQFLKSAGTSAPTWATLQMSDIPDAAFKRSVRVATTAALTASFASNVLTNTGTLAALSIDGVALALNDRVLVKDQASALQNGIYTVTNVGTASVAWTLTRATDADSSSEIGAATVAIDSGTANGGELWTTNFKTTDTLNTTSMTWFEILYNSGTWGISITGNAATVTNGAYLNTAQSFTAAQRGTVVALTDGATITPNFAAGNNFSVTLAGNRTLANPTNLTAGQSGAIVITQDATGSRTLAYGTNWKFSGGTAPTLTTTASAVDVIAYYVESATRITARLIADVK